MKRSFPSKESVLITMRKNSSLRHLYFLTIIISCTTLACPYDYENPFWDGANYFAEGKQGMVLGTSGIPAVREGIAILKEGGSAADAALTTMLTQITLSAGSWVSFGGYFTLMYYDAAEEKVYSMNAGFRRPYEEDDPMSIPEPMSEIPSGRTVLVPGLMAGVGEMNRRFCRFDLERILRPAIRYAENGFPMYPILEELIRIKEKSLRRLPDTEKIFIKPDGKRYKSNDIFKQPDLAYTLKRVAEEGVEYMYTGDWGKKFVEIVRSEGGCVSMKDMKEYAVIWSEPVQTCYRGFDVYTVGLPCRSGANLTLGLNLMEAMPINEASHYTQSVDTLHWLIQATRVSYVFEMYPYLAPNAQNEMNVLFTEEELIETNRSSKKLAAKIWSMLNTGEWKRLEQKISGCETGKSAHTDAIIAIDKEGNVAAIQHTINAFYWGNTGIFVDGVSIPDSATLHREDMLQTEVGGYVYDISNPLIVLKDGKFVHASSNQGADQTGKTLQNLYNTLDCGMEPKDTVKMVNFLAPASEAPLKQCFLKGSFPSDLLRALKDRGQPYMIVNEDDATLLDASWIGVTIDPIEKIIKGAIPQEASSFVFGHASGFY